MYKLKEIVISGFKNEDRVVEYKFSDTNTTIIYGDNGCGKTTFLSILHAIFVKDDDILYANKVRKIELTLDIDGVENKIVIRELNEEETENEGEHYDWTELDKSRLEQISSLLLGVERGSSISSAMVQPGVINEFMRTSSTGSRILSEFGNSYAKRFSEQLSEFTRYRQNRRLRYRSRNIFDGQHLLLKGNNIDISNIEEAIMQRFNKVKYDASEKIQSALFKTFSQVINEKGIGSNKEENLKYVIKELEPNYLVISRSLDSISDSDNNDVLRTIKGTSIENLLEKCRSSEHICLLMRNIIDSILPEREVLNSVLLLQKTFDSYLANDKRLEISDSGLQVIIGEKSKHSISDLSSGERQFLTLLTCFIIDSSTRNIILIDEPEISLNVRWQNELINLITKCAPETQIILATHSPSVVNDHIECIKELV